MFPGVVRHCRSPGVLAFLCLAASALLVLGVTSPVEEAWNSCQEECRESASCFESTATGSRACIGDSRKCRERYQCSRHDSCPKCALLWEEEQKAHESLATCKSRCRTSPGPDLPVRGRQLSLSLSFLAVVSCLHFEGAQKGGREGREGRKVGCCGGGCGCGDSPGAWLWLGSCALVPSMLFLLAYLFLLHPKCEDRAMADCQFILYFAFAPFSMPIPQDLLFVSFAVPTVAACCCLTRARFLLFESKDGDLVEV